MKRKGLKLAPRLMLVVAVPLLLMFGVAVAGINSSCSSVTEAMVLHELQAAQYAFEVSVNNISQGTYMYSNGIFYKGKRNISENTEFFDNFSHMVDLEVTVFYDNTRVATSLVDKNGNRMVGTTADPEIYEKVVKQGENFYTNHVDIGGELYYAMYCPLYQTNKDEIIGMTFVGLKKTEINAIYMSNFMRSFITLLIIFLIGLFSTFISVSVIVKGIKRVIEKLNQLVEGKLNIQVEDKILTRADEIGDIGASVQTLVSRLSEIVVEIKEASKNLDEISGRFSTSFNQMTGNIENVDISVEEMATSSTQQAQDTTEAGNKVKYMGDAIETTSFNVEGLVGNTDKMRNYNKSVESTLTELIRISDDTKDAFDIVHNQTNMTNQSAQEIQSAADVITDIADLTNLLSLNASIEAARAGENGKGFAVVADEIRKLAEQSAESARQITGIIEILIKNSNTTVDTMEKVTTMIEKQSSELDKTKTVFNSLNSEIGEVGNAVENIRVEVDKLNDVRDTVLSAVQSLASIAEQNAAGTEQTSASMQELRQIVAECTPQVEKIIDTSKGLAENISVFTL